MSADSGSGFEKPTLAAGTSYRVVRMETAKTGKPGRGIRYPQTPV
ncbi:hypothetical protein [Methanoregula formicica]|nr:hypothetical protein [Methanoregula formicica]